jgi:hypothetical protein
MTVSQRPIVEKPTIAYSIVELARSAGVSESSVRSDIRAKRLFPILLGGKQVVTPEEAQRWRDAAPVHDPDA